MTSRAIVPIILVCVLVTNARLLAGDEPVAAKPGARAVSGSWTPWVFESRPFFDPLIAEPGAAVVDLMAVGSSSAFPYSQTSGRRRVWNISVGKEIPLFGWDHTHAATSSSGASQRVSCFDFGGYPPPGCSGIGVWLPVGLHTVEDFKDPSNPIVDTNYRFGAMIKFEHRFGRAGVPSDTVRMLKLRLHFGHQSTHLGDEFILAAERANATTSFQRINVSYQYWEYGVSYERVVGTHTVKVRHGGAFLDPLTASWRKGFYSVDPLETNQHSVTPSHRKFEPSFGFESFKEKRDGEPPAYRPFISADVRLKTVYDYNRLRSDQPETAQWSTNVMAGLRRAQGLGDHAMPSLYVRLYYGVNPWGQLGSQRGYFVFGAGLHLVL
jgi:hypothetical protein